tara:strand:- start:1121 stop:1330 length:210 start_codon:yes stop_codon:yes gene_type:complete
MTILERIDGLVNRADLEMLKFSIQNMVEDLIEDGFEIKDIKKFLVDVVEKQYNVQRVSEQDNRKEGRII